MEVESEELNLDLLEFYKWYKKQFENKIKDNLKYIIERVKDSFFDTATEIRIKYRKGNANKIS